MKKRLVIANWKMYLASTEDVKKFVLTLRRKTREQKGVEVWLAPPFPFIAELAKTLESSPVRVGAQTVSAHMSGAHTGEVSASMLKQAGALFAVVGHSERRAAPPAGEGETNEWIAASLAQAAEAGLAPVLCVGEREREHDGEHFGFIERQLAGALKDAPPAALKKLVVAYEPIWAIGKEASDAIKPADLEEMVIFIRKVLADVLGRAAALKVPILYGGSVEPENATTLLEGSGVNGFLVGHASADIESFLAILAAVQNEPRGVA